MSHSLYLVPVLSHPLLISTRVLWGLFLFDCTIGEKRSCAKVQDSLTCTEEAKIQL